MTAVGALFDPEGYAELLDRWSSATSQSSITQERIDEAELQLAQAKASLQQRQQQLVDAQQQHQAALQEGKDADAAMAATEKDISKSKKAKALDLVELRAVKEAAKLREDHAAAAVAAASASVAEADAALHSKQRMLDQLYFGLDELCNTELCCLTEAFGVRPYLQDVLEARLARTEEWKDKSMQRLSIRAQLLSSIQQNLDVANKNLSEGLTFMEGIATMHVHDIPHKLGTCHQHLCLSLDALLHTQGCLIKLGDRALPKLAEESINRLVQTTRTHAWINEPSQRSQAKESVKAVISQLQLGELQATAARLAAATAAALEQTHAELEDAAAQLTQRRRVLLREAAERRATPVDGIPADLHSAVAATTL